MNSASTASVTLEEEAIDYVEHFTYLGNVVDTQGGTEAGVKAMIGKARTAFLLSLTEEHLSILSPFLEKQDQDSPTHPVCQDQDFQYTCQGYSYLRSTDIVDHSDHRKEDTDICQLLSKKNPWCLVASHSLQASRQHCDDRP